MRALSISVVLAILASAPAAAQIAMSGDFKATGACPATQSIRNGANPGNLQIEIGHGYRLIAKNKPAATHYLIAIEGASPRERWVAIGCGAVAGESPSAPAPAPMASGGAAAPAGEATHVLAIGWEPAFCEGHGDKAECQRETDQSFDATHFSLHGLWPQPKGNYYCGVDRSLRDADRHSHWDELPEPDLSDATRARLAKVMPGVASSLERHEWIKHGTCFHAEANAYFNRAAELIEQANASAAGKLFASRIGQNVTAQEIRAAFDQSFGPGAGERVQIHCSGDGEDREIDEMIISLAGDVNGSAPLGDLMRAAPPAPSQCPGGKVAEAAR